VPSYFHYNSLSVKRFRMNPESDTNNNLDVNLNLNKSCGNFLIYILVYESVEDISNATSSMSAVCVLLLVIQ
jgi:hypothetical protein